MKFIFSIILALILADHVNAQIIDKKYQEAVKYIRKEAKSGDTTRVINVCSYIEYMNYSYFFSKELQKWDSVLAIELGGKNFDTKYRFDPILNDRFNKLFKNKAKFDKYIVLSKPIKGVLFAAVREGDAEYMLNSHGNMDSYLGTEILYAFFFDKSDNIIKVSTDTFISN